MASLSNMLQKLGDYCRNKFTYSRLENMDTVSTSFCRTPLHTAAMSGDIKFATKILSIKPYLALKVDSNGFTPLHLASARTNLQMVKLLLKDGPCACIAQDEDGRTPLHLAAMEDRVEILKLLLEDGLSDAIHIKNDKETILHLCVKSNTSIETTELLVKKLVMLAQTQYPDAISVTSKDNDGKIILQLAAEMEKTEVKSKTYMNDYLKVIAIRNESGTQNNAQDFVVSLMNSPSFSMTRKGLILGDFNLTSVVSNYKNSNGSGEFIPYLIRYAGYPVLAYKSPMIYTIYMNTNVVAFPVSLIVILLVLSGTVDDYQLRPLVALMCISTLCIGTSYVCILATISPQFYAKDPTIYSVYGFFGLYSYGIIVIVQIVKSRIDKLRNRNLTGINYITAFVSMNASTAGKLILLLFGYCVTLLVVYVTSKPPVQVNIE